MSIIALLSAAGDGAAVELPSQHEPSDLPARLDAYRLIGIAHYENGDFKPAAEQFRRCIELANDSAADRFNLALTLLRSHAYDDSLAALDQARRLDPDMLAATYLRGIIYKRQAKFAEAVECLGRVIAADADCWGAQYNLGTCYKNLRQYDNAKASFDRSVRIHPTHPSGHYQLITLARRTGDVQAAKRHAETFNRVKDTVSKAEKTVEALERSKYSEIIRTGRLTGDPGARAPANVRFTDVTADAGFPDTAAVELPPRDGVAVELPPQLPPRDGAAVELPPQLKTADFNETFIRSRYLPAVGGAVVLADYDGDGDLDVYVVRCGAGAAASANRLYNNLGNGRFVDVTDKAGVGDPGAGMHAVFGDYDNDGHDDLYVVNFGRNVLYHNRGDGTFEDVSRAARVDEPQFGRAAVMVDYDHDNDLDLLVVNDAELGELPEAEQLSVPGDLMGQVNTLLRNNGDGTFADQTDEAGLLVDFSQSRAVVFADFDGDFDTDLLVANADAPSLLFANARLGTFATKDAFSPAIDRDATAVAEGDFDRDGDPDLAMAVGQRLMLYTNGGKADFRGTPLELPAAMQAGVGSIEVLDYNGDGSRDLLLVGSRGRTLGLLAGDGKGSFRDVTAAVGLDGTFGQIADAAAGDVDGDGDEDILLYTRDRGLRLLRNDTDAPRRWLNVRLVGEKVNRNGYGATVEIAVGGHYQRQTARDGWVHFGLGSLQGVDVVRVTWPNGVAQSVIRPKLDANLKIPEHVRISASCAMLWAHNGRQWQLINEILGVGPLGVPIAPGVYHAPDCTELTKIEADQLAAKDGFYELRITEELREITFADRMTLRVVDHPAGLEIVANEMFTAPPFPADKFFAVGDARAPRRAVDDRGTDVLPLILERDRRCPTFPVTKYHGLARPHALTLDLGDLSGAKRIMLYLDAWIYWPESSTVAAVAQDPRFELLPLSLEVRDGQGKWQTAIRSVGLPTSKGMVVPVDLSGRFLADDYHVRLKTNLCVYFDRVFVCVADEAARCRVVELPVARADLRYRGFSRMTRDRLGFERFDYSDVNPYGPWSPPQGMFTRYGRVTPLLATVDDMFVIFGPGDELVLRFDGRKLPKLPDGWVRDFVFYANGWVKDGDLNTALSESVGPLPFHGMSGYPYAADEHYPRTPELLQYRRAYNTRPSAATVRRLHGE